VIDTPDVGSSIEKTIDEHVLAVVKERVDKEMGEIKRKVDEMYEAYEVLQKVIKVVRKPNEKTYPK
jgi:hypothetical protein